MKLDLIILRSDEGTPTGLVTNTCIGCSPSYRLYGGCDTMNMGFISEFDDPPIATKGDMVQVLRNGVPLFSGRVQMCEPQFGKSVQELVIEGWWNRLKEREAVSPPLLDHITFGPDPGSDHPTITTAYEVMQWILQNRILNDPDALITQGTVTPPAVPCKLSGPFMLYAKDDLSKVMETLATMEDCVTGIDSAGRFYYIPRNQVLGSTAQVVYVKKAIPADWRDRGIGISDGGGRFVYDRRGPNSIAVHSRDSYDDPSIRSYRLVGVLPPSTKRSAGVRVANIHTGQQARRYARGLFRRFADYSMKVEELSFRTSTKRLEPHLGVVRIEGDGIVYAENIAGQINLDIKRSTLQCSVTLGENAADPGSGNPLNDPFANSPGWDDDPQVDTGLGTDLLPDPSGDIDFNDGYDGDGDGLHSDGPLTVDYGSDERNPDNGPVVEEPGGGVAGGMKLGVIVDDTQHPNYSVRLHDEDGNEIEGAEGLLENVPTWPQPVPKLRTGQKVLVMFPAEDKPYIDGAIGGRELKLHVKSVAAGNKYEVDLLDPLDNVTIIASYSDVIPFPTDATFAVGDIVSGYWFNGAVVPTLRGTGNSTCAMSINSFGVKFG